MSWRKTFEIDYRALALFRIGVAICLIWDSVLRLFYVRDFLTDQGVFPLALYQRYIAHRGGYSIHAWTGGWEWPAFLLVISILLGVAIFANFFPRTCAALSWLLVISVCHRNPHDQYGGDILLRAALMWSMFLPFEGPQGESSKTFFSGAGAALFLQLAMLYFLAGWLKTNPIWWPQGSATYYSIAIQMYASPLAKWFLSFPFLLKAITYFVIGLERIGCLFFLLPFFQPRLRTITYLLFTLMHLGFALLFNLRFFVWLDLTLLLPVLPSEGWDYIDAKLSQIFSHRLSDLFFYRKLRIPAWRPNVLPVLLFVLVAWLSGQFMRVYKVPSWVNRSSNYLRLTQCWNMFTNPTRYSGWFVTRAELADGSERIVTPHGFGSPSIGQPASIFDTLPNLEWRRYFPVLLPEGGSRRSPAKRSMARFFCRVLNREEKMHVKKIRIDYMREWTPLPGQNGAVQLDQVVAYNCRRGERRGQVRVQPGPVSRLKGRKQFD